jgi:hypothetical protein
MNVGCSCQVVAITKPICCPVSRGSFSAQRRPAAIRVRAIRDFVHRQIAFGTNLPGRPNQRGRSNRSDVECVAILHILQSRSVEP